MRHDLEKPCKNCPFLKGGEGVGLPRERFEEIVDHHTVFPCHKTVEYTDDGSKVHTNSQACAGFIGYMTKHNKTNRLMQIGFALGVLSPERAERLAKRTDIIDSIEEGTIEYRYGRSRNG